MELKIYHKKIIDKYKEGSYSLKGKKDSGKPVINEQEYSLYAVNYLIWEFMKNNKDDRWKMLLDFVVVPTEIELIDLSKYTFEDFLKFMISVKT